MSTKICINLWHLRQSKWRLKLMNTTSWNFVEPLKEHWMGKKNMRWTEVPQRNFVSTRKTLEFFASEFLEGTQKVLLANAKFLERMQKQWNIFVPSKCHFRDSVEIDNLKRTVCQKTKTVRTLCSVAPTCLEYSSDSFRL